MILLYSFVIYACIFSCGAQDSSLDNLIADIFKTDETQPSSTIQPTPHVPNVSVNPKDSSPTGTAQYQSCGYQKECVPRWLCSNNTINTSGENIIDIRIDSDAPCKNPLELCCDLPNKVLCNKSIL